MQYMHSCAYMYMYVEPLEAWPYFNRLQKASDLVEERGGVYGGRGQL